MSLSSDIFKKTGCFLKEIAKSKIIIQAILLEFWVCFCPMPNVNPVTIAAKDSLYRSYYSFSI